MSVGIHRIADTIRAEITKIALDVEDWAVPVAVPAGVDLRAAPPEHGGTDEALRSFQVLPQPDPRATEFNGSLVSYRQTLDIELRYHVPPQHDAKPGEWDGRERAHRIAASDAARISHHFCHDYGWASNHELVGFDQIGTRPLQPLGSHRYLMTLEFAVQYLLPSNPTGG